MPRDDHKPWYHPNSGLSQSLHSYTRNVRLTCCPTLPSDSRLRSVPLFQVSHHGFQPGAMTLCLSFEKEVSFSAFLSILLLAEIHFGHYNR